MIRNKFTWFKKLILLAGGLVALLMVIRLLWLKPYEIPSPSMEPTLIPGDCIIVNKLAYLRQRPARGDIVVFRYPEDPERTFIKRVIALGGESFAIINSQVYINGTPLTEPYLREEKFASYGPQSVPKGYLLVLGDNRNNSWDSRNWGLLPLDDLLGRALVVYSPVYRLGILR